MKIELSDDIIQAVHFVHSYASGETDWLKIKKEILKCVKPSSRTAFSSRHPVTKKQEINQFDVAVATYWEGLSGSVLTLKQDGKNTKITT